MQFPHGTLNNRPEQVRAIKYSSYYQVEWANSMDCANSVTPSQSLKHTHPLYFEEYFAMKTLWNACTPQRAA